MENDLQRIDLKVLAIAPAKPPLDPILTIFDRWRKEEDAPSDWVDLADYAHMPQGPGVMMAGKRENFAVDTNEPGLGILLQTRKDLDGAVEQRFLEAFRRHLRLAARLAGEAEWPSEIKVDSSKWLITVNDRLHFPNNDESEHELKTGLVAALDHIFGQNGYQLKRDEDQRHRYGYALQADSSPALGDLLAHLS